MADAEASEFERNFGKVIDESDAHECYLFRERCRHEHHKLRRGDIQACFPQILEIVNGFVVESQALARGRLHLCGFIQLGNNRAASVSILAKFLTLSEKHTPGTVFTLQIGGKFLLTRCIFPIFPRFSERCDLASFTSFISGLGLRNFQEKLYQK
jgi:hypothetical protein